MESQVNGESEGDDDEVDADVDDASLTASDIDGGYVEGDDFDADDQVENDANGASISVGDSDAHDEAVSHSKGVAKVKGVSGEHNWDCNLLPFPIISIHNNNFSNWFGQSND